MEEIEVFRTEFFQRLCEERKRQLTDLGFYAYLYGVILRDEMKHDTCELPPTVVDIQKYQQEITTLAHFLLSYADKTEEQFPKEEVDCEDKISDITNKLKPKWTLDSLENAETSGDSYVLLGKALLDLSECYKYLRKNIEYILAEIACTSAAGKDFCLIDKFFDLEKTYRGLTEKHYKAIAVYTASIRESRKNIPGAEEKRQRKESRKQDFINLLKAKDLYDRDKLRNLKKFTDKETRMLLMREAKNICKAESDRTIQNYIKEIIEDLTK